MAATAPQLWAVYCLLLYAAFIAAVLLWVGFRGRFRRRRVVGRFTRWLVRGKPVTCPFCHRHFPAFVPFEEWDP